MGSHECSRSTSTQGFYQGFGESQNLVKTKILSYSFKRLNQYYLPMGSHECSRSISTQGFYQGFPIHFKRLNQYYLPMGSHECSRSIQHRGSIKFPKHLPIPGTPWTPSSLDEKLKKDNAAVPHQCGVHPFLFQS